MKYYCIKLIKDTYSCVVLDKSFIQLTYHESLLFNSFDELLVFFKNKNDICISIFQSDFINTSIDIKNEINNKSIINDLIKTKLTNDQLDTSDIILPQEKQTTFCKV